MSRPHRGLWEEHEIAGQMMLVHPGWIEDRESLATAIREAGWFALSSEAHAAAERAELVWSWIGLSEELELQKCQRDGWSEQLRDFVSDVWQVTLARV